jgi:hypothetical protein
LRAFATAIENRIDPKPIGENEYQFSSGASSGAGMMLLLCYKTLPFGPWNTMPELA